MRIGVPTERKPQERRVALAPAGARELTRRGHEVRIETGAGAGVGLEDAAFRAAGAVIVGSGREAYAGADLVLKVAEPQAEEYDWLVADQTIFGFLHLTERPELTYALLAAQATAIACETVGSGDGALPLLAPMSEIAGRLAVQIGCRHLESESGGRGLLLGGVPGVARGQVGILGAGVAGTAAARRALGLETEVVIVDASLARLTEIDRQFQGRIATRMATEEAIAELARASDLLICAAQSPGMPSPKLVTRAMVATMRPGSVLIDLAIDQGGNAETSRVTTLAWPTFIDEGVVHFCVPNVPGAVARTATQALTDATLPVVLALAEAGVRSALAADPALRRGLCVHEGQVTHRGVADAFGIPHKPAEIALGM